MVLVGGIWVFKRGAGSEKEGGESEMFTRFNR
jgi:hypothetical protein